MATRVSTLLLRVDADIIYGVKSLFIFLEVELRPTYYCIFIDCFQQLQKLNKVTQVQIQALTIFNNKLTAYFVTGLQISRIPSATNVVLFCKLYTAYF